jgi:hypothetical protein
VFGTVHPGSVGLQMTEEHTDVEGPPVPSSDALVIAWGTYPAPATPALLRASGPDVDDDGISHFVEVDRLDDRLPVDTEQLGPYVGTEHANLLALSSNL